MTLASDKRGACNLVEIVGAPTYVEDMWSGLGSVFATVPERELQQREETIDLRLASVGDIWINTNVW